MDTEQLEEHLEAGGETQSLEFKQAMPWKVDTFVKDILAMSNVRDGGVIIVGVIDKTFVRQGVDELTRATYKSDEMRDQMTKFADPRVEFTVSFPHDRLGNQYVAIAVASFREIPVICRRNGADVKQGAIYYRNSNRRTESAPISNSYDMRDLITLAVTRTRTGLQQLGVDLSVDDRASQYFDNELEGL